MKLLLSHLDRLLASSKNTGKFYTYLSVCKVTEDDETYFNENTLPQIYYLYEKGILRKDLVYFSLLAGQNFDLLNRLIAYDKSVLSLDIQNPASLYSFCMYEQKHWLYDIIDNLDSHKSIADYESIHNRLLMLKLIESTNSFEIDLNQLNTIISKINRDNFDSFWKVYLQQLTRVIDTVTFCNQINPRLDIFTIFQFACKSTFLDTLSVQIDLNDVKQWDKITDKLTEYELDDEFDLFTSFVIMATFINLLTVNQSGGYVKKDPLINLTANFKNKIINLRNKTLQIHLLENMFALLFTMEQKEFICREAEIRLIVVLLKNIITELKTQKVFDKDTDESDRLTNLNIHVTDAIWRLELILTMKNTPKVEDQLINYMLAPPESLIHLCLKRDNLEKANQVIEIFNLRNTDLAFEIHYAEVFLKFRKFLRKNARLRKTPIKDCVVDFYKSNPSRSLGNVDEVVLEYFSHASEPFMNLLDLTLTQVRCMEDANAMFELVKENVNINEDLDSNYAKFYEKIEEVSERIWSHGDVPFPGILTSPQYSFYLDIHKTMEEFNETLGQLYDRLLQQLNGEADIGILNQDHESHSTIREIDQLINQYVLDMLDKNDGVQYLLRVFNYLQAFSRILYIEADTSEVVSRGKNSSYFKLLHFNRSELTGKLLFECHLDPTEFERYFQKLNLDFLYHLVGNCFPTVNLHVQENVTIEELFHDNMMFVPTPNIITYIQKRNWLLGFILNQMYQVTDVDLLCKNRLKNFYNYMSLPRIQQLKKLFENDDIIAALQNCISAQKIKLYLEERIMKVDLVSINSEHSSNDGLEAGEEIREEAKTTNWMELYNVIVSVPECQLRKKSELSRLKNSILSNLIMDGFEPESYRFIKFITNRTLRIDTILASFKKWPGQFTIDTLKAEITKFADVDDARLDLLQDWLQKIELSERYNASFNLDSWYHSYKFYNEYPVAAVKKILQIDDVDLLLDFIRILKPNDEILSNVELNYVTKIIELDISLDKVKTLLDNLPYNHTINICNNLLTILRKLEYLQFVADYLNNNIPEDIFLKSVQISLKMLSVFNAIEQEQSFCIISEPLTILEVLVMNTKLDKLATVLQLLDLENCNYKNIISVEKVDALLRTYAEKSLDFRVIMQPVPHSLKTIECKLLQSLESLSVIEKKNFAIPESIPTKEEWVQNEEVTECMCCRQVVFSMFNRRHHCRRCGRVVCYNCSLKRMLVPTYGDILVRVCSDCYEQTVGNSCSSERSEVPSSVRSHNLEYWLLNDDPEHNKIMREEFSYEHAPSVSLCLSLLKYHSRSEECPKFLLEQCEVMLKLLRPTQEPTHEIDYQLVIKMLKSLAIAAKMLSTEHMLSTGASMADRIISQAELLALLGERGCLSLLPMVGAQSTYVDFAVLRRLRDKLLQREQWNVALEVSTKAGLDNTGIFAAWGKSCLKSGSLDLAREKFQRCLDKNKYETLSNTSRFSDLHRSSTSLNVSRSSNVSSSSEIRPSRDPPLLGEIVHILESMTRAIDPVVLEKSQLTLKLTGSVCSLNQLSSFPVQSDTALCIMNRLKKLEEIASGNFKLAAGRANNSYNTKPKIDPIFYEECLYYLNRYGTHLTLLEFYVKHGEIDKALLDIIENKATAEAFVEIYMKCLRDGIVNIFQEHMSKIDSSLSVWKDYLKQLCRHLEKHHYLNCLYQLQLYVGDYLRATMTCIRFYKENITTFTELAGNVRHLQRAEEHLKQILEQDQWVEVASIGQTSTESQDGFQEKMLANPDIILKIDSKYVDSHIRTANLQIEMVEFLARCEAAGRKAADLLKDIALDCHETPPSQNSIPTLFDSQCDVLSLVVLVIISGEKVEDGFSLARRLMDEFKLRPIQVYRITGKHLAKAERYSGVMQLVNCIKSAGVNDAAIDTMLDEVLTSAISTFLKANVTGTKVEDLIKLIKDRGTKVSAFIEAKQLKTAYFLAVKYKRTADIRRIQHEAELLNMPSIKRLCVKLLQSKTLPTQSKDS